MDRNVYSEMLEVMNQCHVTELRTHFDSVSRVLLVLLNYTHLERNAKHDYNHVPVFELVT